LGAGTAVILIVAGGIFILVPGILPSQLQPFLGGTYCIGSNTIAGCVGYPLSLETAIGIGTILIGFVLLFASATKPTVVIER